MCGSLKSRKPNKNTVLRHRMQPTTTTSLNSGADSRMNLLNTWPHELDFTRHAKPHASLTRKKCY